MEEVKLGLALTFLLTSSTSGAGSSSSSSTGFFFCGSAAAAGWCASMRSVCGGVCDTRTRREEGRAEVMGGGGEALPPATQCPSLPHQS